MDGCRLTQTTFPSVAGFNPNDFISCVLSIKHFHVFELQDFMQGGREIYSLCVHAEAGGWILDAYECFSL